MFREIKILILFTIILPVPGYKAKHDHTTGVIPARYQITNQPAPEIDISVINSIKDLKKNPRHFPEVTFPTDVIDDAMTFYFDPSKMDPKKLVNNNSVKKYSKVDSIFSKPKTLSETLKALKVKIPPLSQYTQDSEYKKKDSFFEKYMTKKLEGYKNKQKIRHDLQNQELASIKAFDSIFNKGSTFANMYKSKHKLDLELFTNLQKMSTVDCNKLILMIEDSINIIEEIVNIAIVQAHAVGPEAAQISQQDVIEIINFLTNLQTILEIIEDFQNMHYDIIMKKIQNTDLDSSEQNEKSDDSLTPTLNTNIMDIILMKNGTISETNEIIHDEGEDEPTIQSDEKESKGKRNSVKTKEHNRSLEILEVQDKPTLQSNEKEFKRKNKLSKNQHRTIL